jgi:two-component system CheB/CheR fusion protein
MHSLDMVAVGRFGGGVEALGSIQKPSFGLQYSGNRLTAQYSDKSYAESERQPIDQRRAGQEEQSARILPTELSSGDESEFKGLLAYLSRVRGFDFRGYKRPSLTRRVCKRMQAVGARKFSAYQDYLELHPDEFAILFNTILINVTGFFRDRAAWDSVRSLAIPEIVRGTPSARAIRAWSAGCATGEEAYTLAMLLAEQLGPEEFRERVKIFATDIDEDVLSTARYAAYNDRQVEGVPSELLTKYFEQVNGLYFFRRDLRRQVIFGRHDLINDVPISRIDILTCRNTLMYLDAETQAGVLSRLFSALNQGGFLLLGRAETLVGHPHNFVAVDSKRRLSRKGSGSGRVRNNRES